MTISARLQTVRAELASACREAGRDPGDVAIEGRIRLGERSPEACAEEVPAWRDLGASDVTLNTMGSGLSSPAAHIDAIRRFKEAVGDRA